ncbi:MAG: TetR/AcrR family transcriptional regulator [Myxococcota bacterium]
MTNAPIPSTSSLASSPAPRLVPLPSPSERPAGRRAQQRADTRERLFHASLAEFQRVGVAAAQIDRIAKAARVVRGTFYFHFPTKDHVLLELQSRVEHLALARVASLATEGATLEDAFRRVCDGIVAAVALTGGGEVLREMLSLYVRKPQAPSDASEESAQLIDAITRHAAAAQARGEVRADLSPEQIATMFLTSTFGFIANHEQDELADVLNTLVDVVMQGIRSRR